MALIKIRFGIGYGSHETEIEVDDDASQEEIEAWVEDEVTQRLDWSWKRGDE